LENVLDQQNDDSYEELFGAQSVEDVDVPDSSINEISTDYEDAFDEVVYDPTNSVLDSGEITPEQEQVNEEVEQEVKVRTGVSVSALETERIKSPVLETVKLDDFERQESINAIIQNRDDAIEGVHFQIDRLLRSQGKSDEFINQWIEDNRKDVLSTSGLGGSRMLSLGPTADMFNVHLAMVKAQTVEGESNFDAAKRFFSNEIDEDMMTTFASMRARGLKDLTKEAKVREAELIKEGLSAQEAEDQVIAEFDKLGKEPTETTKSAYQEELRDLGIVKVDNEDIANVSNAFGVAAFAKTAPKAFASGFKYGSKIPLAGPVGGALGGLGAVAVTSGGLGVLAKMAVSTGMVGRFSYDPGNDADREKLELDTPVLGVRRSANHQIGLAQSIVDELGAPANVEAFLTVATPAAKAELITRAITLADEYGVTEKLKNKESFVEFMKIYGGLDETEPSLIKTARETGINPGLVGFIYHPIVRNYVKDALKNVGLTDKENEAVQYVFDAGEFISDLITSGAVLPEFDDEDKAIPGLAALIADIGSEIAATEKYREQKAGLRQSRIEALEEKVQEDLRALKPSFIEKEFLEKNENIKRGFIQTSKFEYKFMLEDFINRHTWNEANKKWRGKQPDVDYFKDFVHAQLLIGGRREFSDEDLSTAVAMVIEKRPKEELQKFLNNMSLETLSQIGGNNIPSVWKRPNTKEIEKFINSMSTKLEGSASGRLASREQLKQLELETFNRQGTFYDPSYFNLGLGYLSVGPTAGAETPIAVEVPDLIKPIVESMGLPTIYGTPAGVDFMAGDGIRPINSTTGQRITARRRSLTGGFQIGYEEIMLARGYSRDDPKFNIASMAGFVLDMLNVEKYFGKGITNAARVSYNSPSAVRAAFKSGTPASKTILARNALLKNTSFDRTTDPVVSNHQAIKVGAQEDVSNGIDPLSKRMTADERDLFENVLTLAGRNPQDVYEAVARASKSAKTARKVAKTVRERMGPNELLVLRADPDYKRLHNDVFNLVRKGTITADDANRFLAVTESQAIKIADSADNPYRSAAEVIANLEVVTNRPAGAGARFMGKGLEEVDTASKDAFSQPLRRDITTDRIRAIMDDVNIDEADPKFIASLEKKYNVRSLDDLSDTDRIAIKEDLYRGQMGFSKPEKQKAISKAKIVTLQKRYSSQSSEQAPGALTRTSKVKSDYKAPSLRQKTETVNAAEDFGRADTHSGFIGNRNPILKRKDWNQWWGGVTGTKQILEPPLKVQQYADAKKMAAELQKLTPEQKKRADSGIVLVEELGTLYETRRAEPTLTAQLLGWTILSRSLSAFPHESAFLDAFMSAPSANMFSVDFDAFIKRALNGEFDAKALLEYDVWIGGIHRRRAADKLLADGEITSDQYKTYIGQNKDVVDSLVQRKVIEEADAKKFLAEPLPKNEKNKKFNAKVVEAMSDSRKLAESLRRQKLITDEEFNGLVGLHPALRIEGMGNPAAANLRAFGKNFLFQSSDRLPEGKPLIGFDGKTFDFGGQTKLEAWHNILLDLSINGQEARRLYHQIYQNAGIDNKVISFMLLAAGRKDVIVIDRIQANHFWGAAENLLGKKVLRKDGSKVDLYEGFGAPKFKDLTSNSVQSWAKNPRPYSTSRGLADVLNGARGAVLYEAIENLLSTNLDEAYRLVGREGEASLGRFHWETWVINSGQEVGHDTLNVILKQAQGFDEPAVGSFVSEGKFQMRRYGMKYAVLPDNQQAMVVATQDGTNYLFNPESWSKVVSKLTRDGSNVNPADGKPRIVPKGWKLENEKFANTPWYHRASVNRDNLDIAIREHGTAATPEQNLAMERFSGRAGSGRTKLPRAREAGVDEVSFRESTDYDAFEEAKNRNTRPENLAPKTMDEYEGSRVFMIESGDAGFLVKNGDLQNVFNNSGIPGLGTEILKLAIENHGARTLDCFDGFLPKYYSKAGFVEVARVPFVDEFAPPGWNFYKLGRPDIVIMAYQGGDPGKIRSNFGGFNYERTGNRLTDFDAAQELARRQVRDRGDSRGMEAVGAQQPRRSVGEQSLRSRVGQDKTHDSVEPTVIRLVDPTSDTKFQRKKGVPLGYFEYDQRTRIAIINLFEKGDLDTLWHENGHFMATLMGDQYKNTIFKHFDYEVDSNGSRKLTDVGHEEFAEAWRYYRRVRDYPNGYLRRLFDELWISLHNLWSKIRRKPGLLPDAVREYWDLEFGSLPKDRRSVDAAVSGAMFKQKSRSMKIAYDKIDDDSAVSRAQLRVAKDLGYDETVIRSLLGDRATQTYRVQPDLQVSPGQQPRLSRVVERSFSPRSYDGVDAGLEIFALIKNSKFRKDLSGKKMSTVGTERFEVPVAILDRLKNNVNTRMVEAIGISPAKFADQLRYPDKTGLNAIARRSTIPDGVTNKDIAAFQKRLASQDPEKDPQRNRQTVSFFVLDERQQSGFKTLLQELSRQPEADLIPFNLMDPEANLKLMSIGEYTRIRDVLMDVTATPLQRRNRNQVHPGYINSFAAIFKDFEIVEGIGDVLQDIGRFFGKRPKLDPADLDPKLVDIFEGSGRRMVGAGEDLVKYANTKKFGKEDDLYNFFSDVVDNAAPRVSVSNLTGLQRIHRLLNGTVKNMTTDALERSKSDITTGANRPITYDPIGTGGGKLTIEEVGQRVSLIQDLLDGPEGMTPAERQAIIGIRSVYEQVKRGRKTSDFTVEERTVIGHAIQIINLGINEKYQYVKNQAEGIYERVMAVEGVVDGDFRKDYIFDIYRNYYTGNFYELFKMAGNIKNVRRSAKTARRTYNLGFLNKIVEINFRSLNKTTKARNKRIKKEGLINRTLGGAIPEYEQKVISLMVLQKMDEIKQDLARELVRYGYVANRRKIASDLGLLSDVSVDVERYLDRVQFYVNRALQYNDITKIPVDELGKRKGQPTYATQARDQADALYGPAENPNTFRGDSEVISKLDLSAIHEADQIIARLGIKPGRGSLETVEIGGTLFFMPKIAVEFLEDHIQQTFPKSRLKKTWGDKGKVIHRLTGETPEKTLPRKMVDMASQSASSIARVAEFLVSPRSFYHGLLIGTGGLPMIGYGMGVFIGGLSQFHLGRGASETIKAAVAAPGSLGEALPVIRDVSEAMRGEVGFAAAVLARIHGKGAAKPFARAIVLDDGRIITPDMMAESVRKNGWKSAFIDVIKNPDTFENLYNRFNKANPTLANTVAFGAAGAPYGVTSAVLSAALGASFGQAMKPGNIFNKFHRAYAEAFAAIDSYLRIRVLISELQEGKGMEEAARRVRSIMLDYSAMSDSERMMIARYFAFWSYFAQANKLFFEQVIENPDRIITQLKFALSTQRTVTQGRDPDKFLPKWDQYRSSIPFKIGGQYFRLPFLITGDTLGMLSELGTAFSFANLPDETRKKAALSIAGRLSPQIGLGIATVLGVDPGLGFPLDRATLQVPAELIEMDALLFGGALWDFLEIQYVPPSQIKYVFDDPEKGKVRVNPNNIEHPGRGIWISKSPAKYYYLMNYLQTPVTGRMGDNMWALSRSNAGPIEGFVDALEYVKANYSPDKPIMANFGVMQAIGLADAQDRTRTGDDDILSPGEQPYEPPSSIVDPDEQLVTAPMDLLKQAAVAYEGRDGTVEVFTNRFFWPELGRIVGMTRVPGQDVERSAGFEIKRHATKAKEDATKQQNITDAEIKSGSIGE
jgi:hypothetical protein